MGSFFRSAAFSGAIALAASVMSAQRAQAYPVDCAILLCLAGGWPASAECSHARAVFIRRITPWPIEPPLQIWRCPMRAAARSEPSPVIRLWRIAATEGVRTNQASEEYLTSQLGLTLAQSVSNETGVSDIDISGHEFDFVRSVRVWNIMSYSHRERGRDGDCEERYNIQLGTYGEQGEFAWQSAHPAQVPGWVGLNRQCRSGNYYRGVGVEWRDHANTHGHEVVRY